MASAQQKARAKGKRIQNKFAKFLESLNWNVTKAPSQAVWIWDKKTGGRRPISVASDFWGVIDLVCLHKQIPFTLLIQCTTEEQLSNKKKKMEDFRFNPMVQCVQIWMPRKGIRNGVRIIQGAFYVENAWIEMFFRLKNGEWPPGKIIGECPND